MGKRVATVHLAASSETDQLKLVWSGAPQLSIYRMRSMYATVCGMRGAVARANVAMRVVVFARMLAHAILTCSHAVRV